jgi:hypothetical protein
MKNNEMGEACSTYGNRRGTYRGLVGKPERGRPLGKFRRDEKIILKLVFKKRDWTWTGLIWLMIGTGGGSCGCGNVPSPSVKFREFLY